MIKNSYDSEYLDIYHNLLDIPQHIAKHTHHDQYELYYFLNGDVTYYIEGHPYILHPKDILIINNREIHQPIFGRDVPYERIVFNFNPLFFTRLNPDNYNYLYCFENRKIGHHNLITHINVEKYKLDSHIENILNLSSSKSEEDIMMIKTLFLQLLIKLNKIFKTDKDIFTSTTKKDEKLHNVISYIQNNISFPITLNTIVKECFVSKYYLCHFFKEKTGFTVNEYINYKKIILAREILKDGKSALETSELLGYENYSTFYRTFKKIVGVSPQKY